MDIPPVPPLLTGFALEVGTDVVGESPCGMFAHLINYVY